MPSDGAPGAPAEVGHYGEVYDRGYSHYVGERLGRRHAFNALFRYSIQRALGIKKRWTAKVVPIIIYTTVIGAVVIMIGIESFLGDVVMNYADFFVFIFGILGLFVATTAPELLCADRRENVLSLYFSRAITRFDYVLAKLAAMAILTLTISLIPPVLFWLFRQLLADAPLSDLTGNVDELGKIVLAGVLIAFYLGVIALVISSFTTRKPIAIAIAMVGWVTAEAIVGFTNEAAHDQRWSDYLFLLSPSRCVGNLVYALLAPTEAIDAEFEMHLDWWWYAISMVATVVIGCAVMVWRYVPED